jgi:hypothetical protein
MSVQCCSGARLGARGLLQQLCTLWPSQLAGATTPVGSTRGLAAKAKGKGAGRNAPKKNVKQQGGKKAKLRIESVPFNDKDPHLMRIINMLTPVTARTAPSSSTGSDPQLSARAREYGWRCRREHLERLTDLGTKLYLKRAALQSLPRKLRAMAMVEDLRPFPLTRNFLYATPPTAYTED